MGRPKMENPASRQAGFNKRRTGLFKKAHELSVLCDAEVAIINISSEGKVHQFASSSVEKIVARYRKCSESGYRHELQSNPEEPEELVAMEVDVPKQKKAEERESKQQLCNILDQDIEEMNLLETFLLKDKIFKGMLFIKNTKEKLLMEKIEESKLENKKLLENYQNLLRQVVAPEASVSPPIYYPVPVSVHIPPMARDAEFYQWPNFAASMHAITSGHETEGNFQYADKLASSLPSTSSYCATNDHGHFINDKVYVPSFMAFGAAPLTTEKSNEKPMNTLQPPFHWLLPNGDTGAKGGELMIVPSSQGMQ